MHKGSLAYDLVTEFIPGFVGVVVGVILICFTVYLAAYTAIDPPTCRARGEKMGIEVSWGFWPGCMASIKGQWLPWSEVVPVERDGKIIFVPRPQQVVKIER